MKKEVKKSNTWKIVLLVLGICFFVFFIILPISFILLIGGSGPQFGNVAVIPVEGIILGSDVSVFGQQIASSPTIVQFIEEANGNPTVKAIVLEINSPGGSAVASDEIGAAVKRSTKPVVSVIRELGASGGYWIASSSEHIVANRMSITGSIGVISSYLEFSGLMKEYGVGYERLVAGDNKDIGTPYKKLSAREKKVLQKKLDMIHDYFIQEVASNRGMSEQSIRDVATGEFYLGIEALELGLIDELGDLENVEHYLMSTYDLKSIEYVRYQRSAGLLDILSGVLSQFSFNIGEGIGSQLKHRDQQLLLLS
jgi:protease IV